MLNMKGLANVSIFKLVLAASSAFIVITVVTQGNIGEAIQTGFEMSKESTDYTVDVDNEETFSQAAMYVYHRASNDGCAEGGDGKGPTVWKQNNGELSHPVWEEKYEDLNGASTAGYPALSDTYLGSNPPCVGGDSTLIRGAGGTVNEEGQDMEGIYSRVQFEVTKDIEDGPIIISPDIKKADEEYTWLDKHTVAVRRGSFDEGTLSECGESSVKEAFAQGAAAGGTAGALGYAGGPLGFATVAAGAIGGGAIAATGQAVAGAKFIGTGDNFVFFVPSDFEDSRGAWLNSLSDEFDFDDLTYCTGFEDKIDLDSASLSKHPLYQIREKATTGIVLCEGDKGYIQMNKDTPQNEEEAGEKVTGWAKNFPYIEVTERGEDYEESECFGDFEGEPPEVVNDIEQDIERKKRSSSLWINVEIKNNRQMDKKYKFSIIPEEDETDESTDTTWSTIEAGGSKTLNTQLLGPEIGPDNEYGCSVTIRIHEKDLPSGIHQDLTREVDLSSYLAGCGGTHPVQGEIVESESGFSINSKLVRQDKLKAEITVQNNPDYWGQFRAFIRHDNEQKGKVPGDWEVLEWKGMGAGDKETLSGEIGKPSDYDCGSDNADVRVLLKEKDPHGIGTVDAVTFSNIC